MKSPYMKLNFNGGELSPFIEGRIDFGKYTSGCSEMTNFVPTVYGPMTKRPGTRFVADIGEDAALYPFEFSETQAYVFAFKDGSIDIFTGDGRLLDDDNNPVSINSPYTIDQAKTLKFAQTGDLLYLTHRDVGIYKISRTSASDFTGEMFVPVNGPFQDENPDEDIQLTVSGSDVKGETCTITSTADTFTEDDVGSSIKVGYLPSTEFDTWLSGNGEWNVGDYLQYESRIYLITAIEEDDTNSVAGTRSPQHTKGSKSDGVLMLQYVSDGFGYAEITGYTSATEVTAEVKKKFPPNILDTATDEWSWSSFGGRFGWPNAIVFHQQRMVLASSNEQPQTVWGSTYDIEDFTEGTDDDEAYEFTIAANKKNPIEWMASNIDLNIGTLGGEFLMSSSGSSITPTDVNISQIGQYGSASGTSPLIANGFTVFAQTGGRKLRELRYDDDSQRNFARDLNKVADHIVDAGIYKIAYQAEPYQIIWVTIGEELWALTYETDEDVFAWSRQECGNVRAITTIPNGGKDRLWLVIERNGNYYVEYLTDFFGHNEDIENACFVDSSLEYSGDPTTTLSGLDHLEGETVSILNNGSVGAKRTVENGAIELQYPTTHCVVGLPISSAWQSLRLEGGSNDGLGQGKAKRITNVIFRLENTGAGLVYGKGTIDKEFYNSNYLSLPVRETTDDMDAPPNLLNGDTWKQPVDGGSDPQYMMRLEHSEPVPCTIIAMICIVDTAQ